MCDCVVSILWSKRAWYFAVVAWLQIAVVTDVTAQVTFDWVVVGDPGNAPDTLIMDKGPVADMTSGYGAVDYTFRISKTHVTNSQYVQFLNAVDPQGNEANPLLNNSGGIYNFNMTMVDTTTPLGLAHQGGIDFDGSAPAGSKYSAKAGQENFPAIWINWNSAARFVNWLSNGQGSGDTESGVYNNISSSSSEPVPFRQPGATIFLPSEDEFYKAAYYDPTKNNGAGGYWQYGTRSDTPPLSEAPAGGSNSANYPIDAGLLDHPSGDLFWQNNNMTFDKSLVHLTEVGAYTNATSYYGLYDVDGLVYQWTDDGRQRAGAGTYDFPVYRGGSWANNEEFVGAAYRNLYSFAHVASYANFGFRVASLVPEESFVGDYNGDGMVNLADYTVWRDTLGATVAYSGDGADGNANGVVDAADYFEWKNHFAQTAATGQLAAAFNTVPEPAGVTLVLLAVGGLASFTIKRRQSSRN